MRILVVDDEDIKRISLVDDLGRKGHEAIPAKDGEQALEILAKTSFEVVLADLRMPVNQSTGGASL